MARTPFDSVKRLLPPDGVPTWVAEPDNFRLAAYDLFESIYWTEPGTFKVQQRGKDENPIYIPSGRIICNTMNRYVGREWGVTPSPDHGTDTEKAQIAAAFGDLFRRERMRSKFQEGKLYGLIRGDWYWHITGNPDKAPGSRLSVRLIHPRYVFPITPDNDVNRVLGYDIAEQISYEDEAVVKRTRYLRHEHPEHPDHGTDDPTTPVSWQIDFLEEADWQNEEEQAFITHPETMPVQLMGTPGEGNGITVLPIHHVPNYEEEGWTYGSSEMRGLERIMAAVNQTVSDEDLSLALEGLGLYKSSKKQPTDANGNPTPWQLGPGKVVHDETFERVSGVSSVTAAQSHVEYLESRMHRVNGVGAVAQGDIDVTVAESGIALAIRMGPVMDAAEIKNTIIREKMDQLMYSLREWFAVYEDLSFGEARLISTFGKMLPQNDKQKFEWLYRMVTSTPPLITMAYFRDAVRDLGMEIPTEVDSAAVAAEQIEYFEAIDPAGARLSEEAGDDEEIDLGGE